MLAMRFERVHMIILGTAVALFLMVAVSRYDPLSSTDTASQTTSSSSTKHKAGRPLTIEQRMANSEATWQKHVQERTQARAKLPAKFNDWKSVTPDNNQFTIWDFFEPSYSCPWVNARVGRWGDGGKWICGMSRYEEHKERELIVYSFGVNVDSSFEEAFLSDTNARLIAVDFSVNSFGEQLSPEHQNRSTFMKVGLSDKDEPNKSPPFYSMKTLMDKKGYDHIDLLKVDVDGAEYRSMHKFMDDFAKEGVLPISQLSMELHLDDDKNWNFGKVYSFMERFEEFGLRISGREVNFGAAAGEGPIPRAVEYTWVNTKDPKSVLWIE